MPSEPPPPGFELPLRLLLAFRTITDELHERITREGHPDLRPMYGFVLQAIGPQGTTASELGRRLGVTKQAAGKTVDNLEQLGYVERAADPADTRRKVVRLTERGMDCLLRSARIFDELREEWSEVLGEEQLRLLGDGLRRLAPGDPFRLDTPPWFGTP
ncbi:MarR family winged helix-turn-helix transcriptional regulator [Kitasatospora sp. NPDC048286]|uniref:MarR family winged helix-turn-helix transcriptional regulator n=1 Tax=Kitasatospora sp. NPDC048286 TaxID=3364047 RepID=UPI0037159C48